MDSITNLLWCSIWPPPPSNPHPTPTPPTNFNKFLDADGYIEDVAGYHKAIYVLQNYESIMENVYNTAIANHVEKDAETSKNIDMGRSKKSAETIKTGMKMKIIN